MNQIQVYKDAAAGKPWDWRFYDSLNTSSTQVKYERARYRAAYDIGRKDIATEDDAIKLRINRGTN